MQSLTASTPCKPFRSICESFVNYCNLLLQFTDKKRDTPMTEYPAFFTYCPACSDSENHIFPVTSSA